VDIAGVSPDHRVACHWAEQIAAGEVEAHEVDPELVEEYEPGLDEMPVIPAPGDAI
jgi:peptide/nickel transport system ATP-binding protein